MLRQTCCFSPTKHEDTIEDLVTLSNVQRDYEGSLGKE